MKTLLEIKCFLLCCFNSIFLTVFNCRKENINSICKKSTDKKVMFSNIAADNKDNEKREVASQPNLKTNVDHLNKSKEKNNNLLGSNILSEYILSSRSIGSITSSNLQEQKICSENKIEDTQEQIVGNNLNFQEKDDANKELIQTEERIKNEPSIDDELLTSRGYCDSTSIHQEYEELDSITSSGCESRPKSGSSTQYEIKIKECIIEENQTLKKNLSYIYKKLDFIFHNVVENKNMLISYELYNHLYDLYESYIDLKNKIENDYLDVKRSDDNSTGMSPYYITVDYNTNCKTIIDVFEIHFSIQKWIIDFRKIFKKYYNTGNTYEYKDENNNNEEYIKELESYREMQNNILHKILGAIKYLQTLCCEAIPNDKFDIKFVNQYKKIKNPLNLY